MAIEAEQNIAMAIKGLSKIYTDDHVKAVDNISFNVKKGEIFSFLGPNGAGKSTTISIAATQLEPSSGMVEIFGYDIVRQRTDVRKHIGICPQEIVVYENLTVYENLLFFGRMHNRTGKNLKDYAMSLISQTGLEEKSNTLVSKLSGGMKRRLNVIIALIHDPDFLFLDEPTAGLDPQSRRLVWEFLLKLKAKGKTIFLTTHYMDEADFLSDRVAIIDHGKIITLDSPFELKRKYSQGDIIEFKFKEPVEFVENTLKQSNDEIFKNLECIKEDHLFRIALLEGLVRIHELLEKLQIMKLNISDMNVKANSLENVFLNLTGRRLRE